MTHWRWEVDTLVLILGDSNLELFPEFTEDEMQIDAFPGGQFRHAQTLIQNCRPPPDLMVEKVVLAFGLNSRGNDPKATTIKNLQGAVRAAHSKFPHADVIIPLINYSPRLPRKERENIDTLNSHIEAKLLFIPKLPESNFKTADDDISWTPDTAIAMFNHWRETLLYDWN